MMSSRKIAIAASCLLTVLLAVTTAQSQYASQQQHQQQQHQLEQYDPNTPPQHANGEHISGRRIKRMYAMCPPGFSRIGNECYYISTNQQNWLDAHFECKDRNSKLAEPMKFDDKSLRKYLQKSKEDKYIWIGGNYNWRANKWQWGYNGKDIGYQSFSQMVPGSSQDLKYHCAVLNPDLKYRWSAKLCTEKLNFICQHKMPLVNSHSRAKVYTRWNETYPNELANEVEVVVADQPRSSNMRDYYTTTGSKLNGSKLNGSKLNLPKLNRVMKKHNRTQRIKSFRNRHRPSVDFISNDIVRNPVVEYASDHSYNSINGNGNGNGYRNGNRAISRPRFNVDIHRQKAHRGHRVNEENGEYTRHRHRPVTRTTTTTRPTTTSTSTTTTTTTTPAPETVPTEALQVVTPRYQPPQVPHGGMKNVRKQWREQSVRLTPEQREQFNPRRVMTTEKYQHPEKVQQLSPEQKKAHRDKLRERLAQLTPEEREMFFAERAKRKQSKKLRTQNETIP